MHCLRLVIESSKCITPRKSAYLKKVYNFKKKYKKLHTLKCIASVSIKNYISQVFSDTIQKCISSSIRTTKGCIAQGIAVSKYYFGSKNELYDFVKLMF